jgi:general secretion pathway protein K
VIRGARGSVLITVIWTLSLLSVYTVVVNRLASQELIFGRWIKNKVTMRSLAKAGVERAMFEIQNDKIEVYDAQNEAWASNEIFNATRLGEGFFSVECEEELESNKKVLRYGACDDSARINLNTATEQVLKNLVLASNDGVEENRATTIAESIIDWRDADDAAMPQGAEANYYRALSTPYEPRNAPFQSVEELLMVKGMDQAVFDTLKNSLTVYTDGKVNFNTASPLALRALGLSEELTQKVIFFRLGADRLPGTKDDEIFEDIGSITAKLSAAGSFSSEDFAQISNSIALGEIGVASNKFRIHSLGRLIKDSDAYEKVTCVVDRKGVIDYWREGV